MKKHLGFICVLLILIALVVVPLLAPGYIFAIDHILNPNGWTPKIGENIYWIAELCRVFDFLGIPVWILEKILLVLTFFLLALGGYLLTRDSKNPFSWIFASIFLIFNPFFYGRFVDGQISIYFSYALYPLLFFLLRRAFTSPSWQYGLALGFLTLWLCLTALHNAIFLFFIFWIFFIVYFSKKTFSKTVLMCSIVVLCNMLWFVPFVTQGSGQKFGLANEIADYNQENRQEFQTGGSKESDGYFPVLTLNGYWWEYTKRFAPVTQNPYWLFLVFGILWLVFAGIFAKIERKQFSRFEGAMIIVALLSFIFAVGVKKSGFVSHINELMYEYFPMYKWMREPHKWTMFLAIVYAYFGVYWVQSLFKNPKMAGFWRHARYVFALILTALPVLYTSNLLFGAQGQIKITHYPAEWKQIKDIYKKIPLTTECEARKKGLSQFCYNALALPWHQYMKINFTERVVWNWIFRYFSENILFGDNIEKGKVYTNSSLPETKLVDDYIGPNGKFIKKIDKNSIEAFYGDLKKMGISHLFLFKEVDYKKYKWIIDFSLDFGYIEKVEENGMIVFFKIL